jgi:ketosteroid isomerase-like protein
VDAKEQAIRDLYDARARRDWQGVRALLADDVGWYEPASGADHAGTHRGADTVVALLQRLVAVTGGTFQLTPEAFMNAVDYSVCIARWSAERDGRRVEGNDLAVYRFEDEKIGDVWFYDDGYDLEAFRQVFAFG